MEIFDPGKLPARGREHAKAASAVTGLAPVNRFQGLARPSGVLGQAIQVVARQKQRAEVTKDVGSLLHPCSRL